MYTKQETKNIIDTFKALEAAGKVRLYYDYEQENYFDVYGKPDDPEEMQDIIDLIEREGLYYVAAQVACPMCGQWETIDSIGMIIGNPTDPDINPYALDLMAAAIDAIGKEVG